MEFHYTGKMKATAKNNDVFSFCWQLSFVALAAILAYSNTFEVPFVFDDFRNIVNNQSLRNLGNFLDPGNFFDLNPLALTTGSESHLRNIIKTRYIGYFSFALNYHFHGLSLRGYHLTNLVIHITNGFLVYLLARVMQTPSDRQVPSERINLLSTERNFTSFIAAILFVSHPVQTQAVTFVVQRMTSLATMFVLASFLFYLQALRTSHGGTRIIRFCLSFGAAVLGTMTKEFALLIPLYLLVWECTFSNYGLRRILHRLWPYAVVLLLTPLMVFGSFLSHFDFAGIDKMLTEGAARPELTSVEYLFTQMRVFLTYMRLLVWPTGQNLDYQFPLHRSLYSLWVIAGMILVATLAALGIVLIRKARRAPIDQQHGLRLSAFLLWAFLLAFIPESSILPIADVIFEHRLYAPSVWFFILSALLIQYALHRVCPSPKRRTAYSVLVCIVLVVPLITATYLRNRVWHDNLTLWRDVVSKSPEKARPRQNLAKSLNDSGLYSQALAELLTGLKNSPHDLHLLQTLSDTYRGLGQLEAAIRTTEEVLKVEPGNVESLSNLGILNAEINRLDIAERVMAKVVALDSARAESFFNQGLVFRLQGRLQQAEQSYLKAIRLRPDYAEAHYNMGLLYSDMNLLKQAENHYQLAIIHKPDFISSYNNLSVILNKQGRFTEARALLTRALRIAPGNRGALRNLELLQRR